MSRQPGYRDVRPITDLVTDEDCYEAMKFLDTIAHDFASAYAQVDYRTYMLRQVEAVGAITIETDDNGKRLSNDARVWHSRSVPAYTRAIEALRDAQMRFKEIDAKRAAAQLKIEVWRTIHADKRSRDVPEPGRR